MIIYKWCLFSHSFLRDIILYKFYSNRCDLLKKKRLFFMCLIFWFDLRHLQNIYNILYLYLILVTKRIAIGWLKLNGVSANEIKWIIVMGKRSHLHSHTRTHSYTPQYEIQYEYTVHTCELQIDKALSLGWQRDDVRPEINHLHHI